MTVDAGGGAERICNAVGYGGKRKRSRFGRKTGNKQERRQRLVMMQRVVARSKFAFVPLMGGCSQRICPGDAGGAVAKVIVRMIAGLFRCIVLLAMFRCSANHRAMVVMRHHRKQR